MLLGRKTMEALGKPLKNRHHLVVSQSFRSEHDQISVCSSVEEGIEMAKTRGESELFIAGGGTIYKYCLDHDLVDTVYLTRVHHEFEGDTFFPELGHEWKETSREDYEADEKNEYSMSFITYEKKGLGLPFPAIVNKP